MSYTATGINTSATIVAPAAAEADVRGKGIKLNAEGQAVVAGAGEVAIGLAIITNDDTVKVGEDVDIQVKEIGLALAGGAIAAGAELAIGADGKVVTATDGNFVVATALESAKAAGKFIRVQITKYQK
mgnify:CR=1 FL=1